MIIIGADVTHPDPGGLGRKPSIAAVVGSRDPSLSVYNTEVKLQPGDQAVEEITDLRTMVHSLLLKFYQYNNQRRPEKIIFYRDGVSEGQFDMVLLKVINANWVLLEKV